MLSYAPTGLIVPDGEGNFKGGSADTVGILFTRLRGC